MKVNKIFLRKESAQSIIKIQKDELSNLEKEILELLEDERFVEFTSPANCIYDHENKLLWYFGKISATLYHINQQGYFTSLGINKARNPKVNELKSLKTNEFITQFTTQFSQFNGHHIYTGEIGEIENYQLFKNEPVYSDSAKVLPVVELTADENLLTLIKDKNFKTTNDGNNELSKKLNEFQSLISDEIKIDTEKVKHYFLNKDNNQSRQAVLEELDLTDTNKGLWELYYPEGEKPGAEEFVEIDLENKNWEARNPEKDIAEHAVTIDFGTSSTVVAFRDNNGQKKLLRIGLKDLYEEVKEEHFENPTVLQFFDYQSLKKSLDCIFHSPDTFWHDAICSHEAKGNLTENSNSFNVVRSILPSLKTWATKDPDSSPLRLTDINQEHEFAIPNHNPDVEETADRDFDPIEFYAYLLGLFINNRKNGLHLKYYLTFPVKYPNDVKSNILTSFKTGLKRSLPETISYSSRLKEFSVEEIASEPLAYAITAIKESGLYESSDKNYFSVFDFGGGTADFAYGLHREAKGDEINLKGLEDVMEHYYSTGDQYLGGEHILENLAYLVFRNKKNLELCRKYKIPFSRPNDAFEEPGLEAFLDDSSIARANMTMMISTLKDFWFSLGKENETIEPLSLDSFLSKNGQTINIIRTNSTGTEVKSGDEKFTFDFEELSIFVYEKILKGIEAFFTAMKTAFKGKITKNESVNIFLAGNASRSLVVQRIFKKIIEKDDEKQQKHDLSDSERTLFGRFSDDVLNTTVLLLKDKEELSPSEQYNYLITKAHEKGYVKVTDFLEIFKEEKLDMILFDKIKQYLELKSETTNLFDSWLKENVSNKFIKNFHYKMKLHLPLLQDEKNPYKPTCKTGVALGLLELVPGEPIKIDDKQGKKLKNEAPFQYFVGKYHRGKFIPKITQNHKYKKWEDLGRLPGQAVKIVYSKSPLAAEGNLKREDSLTFEKTVHFTESTKDKSCFISAVSHNKIRLVLVNRQEEIVNMQEDMIKELVLD